MYQANLLMKEYEDEYESFKGDLTSGIRQIAQLHSTTLKRHSN